MRNAVYAWIALLCCGTLLWQCSEPATPSHVPRVSSYPVPQGFPPLLEPADNPITQPKIELGRILFYDPIISRDSTLSCASCHQQRYAFSDTLAVSKGTADERGLRNAPPLINLGYTPTFFWDGRAHSLEEQILAAMTSPIEMASDTLLIGERLRASQRYRTLFYRATGSDPSVQLAVNAIATFCRVLLSGNSRYDQFRRGNSTALSASEQRGMKLFFSQRTQCSQCHAGILFTDVGFHSIGIHSHYYDRGRYYVTENERDIGKFKTPTLRNVALTAPYMNDGTLATLAQVLEHYNSGGRPFINKDPRIRPLGLTSQELDDLQAFLHALTDSSFIVNPAFAQP